MPFSPTDDDRGESSDRSLLRATVPILLVGMLAVVPATAAAAAPATDAVVLQSSDGICDPDSPIDDYLEGIMQISTVLGLVGLIAVWQVDTLVEIFTLDPIQKRKLKQHKRSAAKAAVVLLLIGPVFAILTNAMGIDALSCVDLFGVL